MPAKKIVFVFLDTGKHVSPFDILMAVDLFPDAQIFHYGNVEPDDAKKIIQDAMFPRGPDGAKYTKVFIGGYDVEKAVKILEVAKKSMFPPFEMAIIWDPQGSCTTASAAVAKTLAHSLKREFGGLSKKSVTILAGTGPVGRMAAYLYAKEDADVIITSRRSERAASTAEQVNMETGTRKVRGMKASSPVEIGTCIKDADIILSAGAAGVQLLPLDVLKQYGSRCKIVADVNAVPPLGVEGLRFDVEDVEILPGIWGVGALPVGTLKNQIEAKLFKRAVDAPRGIFDYKTAYEIAKSIQP